MMRWWAISAACIAALLLFLAIRPGEEPAPLPRETWALASRLAQHPTDWEAASALSERALDEAGAGGVEAWRVGHELAAKMAAGSKTPHLAYARAGFFHWPELSEGDRQSVLVAIEPSLHDVKTFERMARPLFELTGDLGFLRRACPGNVSTLLLLNDLALTNGRFDDYRELRAELAKARASEFAKQAPTLTPSQIIASLPVPIHTDDDGMVVAALRALHERPLDENPGRPQSINALVDYVSDHHAGAVDGLARAVHERTWASAAARAKLARLLGKNDVAATIERTETDRPPLSVDIGGVSWVGTTHGDFVYRVSAVADGPRPVSVAPAASDEVPPYVELFVDDERAAEGVVVNKMTIGSIPPGRHRVELTLANPRMRNRGLRSVRVE